MSRLTAAFVAISCLSSGAVYAQDIFKEAKASFIFNGEGVRINRDNPEVARFASSGDTCGAACIAPMGVADGIVTFGETAVLEIRVNNLLAQEYPSEKIHYDRGGMQVWSVFGFSIEEGSS